MNPELGQILALLQRHREEIRTRFKAEVIGVFGSVARGEQKHKSDVDVLVRFSEGASLFDLVGLGNFLEEMLGCKVDIVSERTIRPEFRDTIMRDLVKV